LVQLDREKPDYHKKSLRKHHLKLSMRIWGNFTSHYLLERLNRTGKKIRFPLTFSPGENFPKPCPLSSDHLTAKKKSVLDRYEDPPAPYYRAQKDHYVMTPLPHYQIGIPAFLGHK